MAPIHVALMALGLAADPSRSEPPSPETDVASPRASSEDTQRQARPQLGAYVENDLGVLLLFRGVGVFGGATYGPLRAGVGFYRFRSPYRSLSGAPEGFDLSVDGIAHAELAWHPFASSMNGPYVELVGQLKWQRVENRANGRMRRLSSTLVGPELGWVWRVVEGLYVTPRMGALYYAAPPQGRAQAPVDVGGAKYDNPRHKTWDLYGTIGIGYVFD